MSASKRLSAGVIFSNPIFRNRVVAAIENRSFERYRETRPRERAKSTRVRPRRRDGKAEERDMEQRFDTLRTPHQPRGILTKAFMFGVCIVGW